MSKPKPKTQKQMDAATNARLLKTYNISLEEYNKLAALRDNCCWVSGRPAGDRRLHVDHDHGWKKVKIETDNNGGTWRASALYNGVKHLGYGKKRAEAIRAVKRQLLRASVRGLLSYSINAGLQKFSDNPELLRSGARYLESFAAGETRKVLNEP